MMHQPSRVVWQTAGAAGCARGRCWLCLRPETLWSTWLPLYSSSLMCSPRSVRNRRTSFGLLRAV